jgi:transcriptional regulator with XRE-family HTH domain
MLGTRLRELREGQGLLLREVAAYLEMDTAMLSKMEREERKAQREHVVKLARYFKVELNSLLILWLSDKINDVIEEEQVAREALELSLQNIKK